MKNRVALALLLVAVFCVTVTGCSGSPSQKGSAEPFEQTIIFPVSDAGKTEFNAAVYDIAPFTAAITLPKGWTLAEAPIREPGRMQLHYLYDKCCSVVNIYNELRECVGAIGYGIYEHDEEAGDNRFSIYLGFGLGSGYFFNMSDRFTPVKESGAVSVAVTEVYYSAWIMEDIGLPYLHKINKGILAHNEELLVYIAVEFDGTVLTDDELKDIAESVDIY